MLKDKLLKAKTLKEFVQITWDGAEPMTTSKTTHHSVETDQSAEKMFNIRIEDLKEQLEHLHKKYNQLYAEYEGYQKAVKDIVK